MFDLSQYQEELLRLHHHICPRQVLGLRMGELAGQLLGIALPQTDKRLVAFVETDGCFADGVMVATGCSLGHRTMRLQDYGKIAVTIVDTESSSQRAFRIWPHAMARSKAGDYAETEKSRWHTQLAAYQVMPTEELLCAHPVELMVSMSVIISRHGVRVTCATCGEEIINQREALCGSQILCRACADESTYYRPSETSGSAASVEPPVKTH